MDVKMQWSDADFLEMSWHDNYIHTIAFPGDDCEMILDIDYIFEWEFNEKETLSRFWISPCSLTFSNVSHLKIDLYFKNSVGLEISNIKRGEPRISANGSMTIWKYTIETDKGAITFESTGFIQKVNKPPVLNDAQILPR